MPAESAKYHRILVATDFSAQAEAALRHAVWLARRCQAQLTLVHVLFDRPGNVLFEAGMGGVLDDADRLIEQAHGVARQSAHRKAEAAADERLRKLVHDVQADDLSVATTTLVGEPFVEITRFAQREKIDLILIGSTGLSAWEEFLIGSTATRLVRKCPSAVWIARSLDRGPPRKILAATDFSDLGRKAVDEAWQIAQLASAELHLLHVIDGLDLPEDVVGQTPEGVSIRKRVNDNAERRLDEFIHTLGLDPGVVHRHLSWGTPWKEIGHFAQHFQIDLVVIGTVGRSGIRGLLLGNTAERVLHTCGCGILTVKPTAFESPIH